MMKKDHKGGLALLLGMPKEGSADDGTDEENYDGSDDIETIAKDMIDSLKHNDAAALVDCLRAAFMYFEQEPHDEVDHTEED